MILVHNLQVLLRKKLVLDQVSCVLEPGRITCFIGKSGAGKTTLLKTLVNLIKPETGKILVNTHELSMLTPRERSEQIGYVFQDFNLFEQMNVLENCIDPQLVHGKSYEQAKEKALNLLREFDLEELCTYRTIELSGGQKQRVAIIR